MMKCDDFKFEYTVAPKEIAGVAAEHLQSCSDCQAFVTQQQAFEEQLAGVVNVETPTALRHSLRDYVKTHKALYWSFPKTSIALAASLLMAVGVVSVNLNSSQDADLFLDQLVVEHMAHDGAESVAVSSQMNPQQLAKVGQQFGVKVSLAEHISFAEKCPIGDSYGLHMVYQYRNQPVTIIYMPEISLEATLPFHYAGLHGWVKPLKNGSIAVLGGSTVELPNEKFTDDAIEWL